MRTYRVHLSIKDERLIRKNVKSGSFRNASEVVSVALQLLEQRQRIEAAKLRNLRRLFKQGNEQLQRGQYVEVSAENLDEFIESLSAGQNSRKWR